MGEGHNRPLVLSPEPLRAAPSASNSLLQARAGLPLQGAGERTG